MLIDRAAEEALAATIKAVASSFSVYLMGRQLGSGIFESVSVAVGLGINTRYTILETAYLAGKIATIIGPDRLKKMTEEELIEFIRQNNITLDANDRAVLKELKGQTERWLNGRSEAWQNKLKAQISRAEREFRAALSTGVFNDAKALAIARQGSLRNLIDVLQGDTNSYRGEVDRLVQSEMNLYFQQGQVTSVPGEKFVYKIPRMTACRYCIQLHIAPDGSYRKYRLAEVLGNTNHGAPAGSWKFTIGPVHPYCYCQLVYEEQRPTRTSERRAARRRMILRGLLKKAVENSCGVPEEGDPFYDDLVTIHPHEPVPTELTRLMKALESPSLGPPPPK